MKCRILLVLSLMFLGHCEASHNNRFNNDNCNVTILDVGQGNCFLIQNQKDFILVDGGSSEFSYSNLNDRLFSLKNSEPIYILDNDVDKEKDDEEKITTTYEDHNGIGFKDIKTDGNEFIISIRQ